MQQEGETHVRESILRVLSGVHQRRVGGLVRPLSRCQRRKVRILLTLSSLNPIPDAGCASCLGVSGTVCKECWVKDNGLQGLCQEVKGNAAEAKCVAPLCEKVLRSN